MMEVKLLCAAVLLILVSTLTGTDTQSNVCGIAPLNTRIVGGQDAAEGAWPWQARVIANRVFCGGSLINDQWVLTAAHCLDSTSAVGVTVYLGRRTQAGPNPNGQRCTVMQIIRHPEYDSRTFNNDIALVKLSSPVRFTNYTRPVCLSAADSVYEDGTNTWVTGWGNIQTNENLPPDKPLQEVEIFVVSNSVCNKIYSIEITDNMICAGVASGGRGPCFGDSGGPMMTTNGSMWIQGGVVSFGSRDCALPDIPSVFTRVSQYESWINSQITTNQPGFISFSPSPPSSIFSASSSAGSATGVFLTVLSLYVLS